MVREITHKDLACSSGEARVAIVTVLLVSRFRPLLRCVTRALLRSM